MNALPIHAVVVTREDLYDHRGELIARGSLGTVVLCRVALSSDEHTYEVELVGEGGRGRRVFTAMRKHLDVISVPSSVQDSAAVA